MKRSDILSPRVTQVREFVSSTTGAMVGRALSKGKRATVRGWTAFVVVCGVAWLVLEFTLRGGEAPIRVDWMIAGTVESLVNGEQRRVGPGSVIFQASNQMHGIRNVGDGPATYHVIRWNSPGMLKK